MFGHSGVGTPSSLVAQPYLLQALPLYHGVSRVGVGMGNLLGVPVAGWRDQNAFGKQLHTSRAKHVRSRPRTPASPLTNIDKCLLIEHGLVMVSDRRPDRGEMGL